MSAEPYGGDPRRKGRRAGRIVVRVLLAVLLLAAVLVVAVYLLTTSRLPLGTSVEGTSVGGLRPADAEARLVARLGGRAAGPITVEASDELMRVRPGAAGFSVDVPTTVALLRPAPSWDPGRIWHWFTGRTRVDAIVHVDRDALDRTVARLAGVVDDPAVQGAVTFAGGRVEARYPQPGSVLDRPAAAAAITAAFLHDRGPDRVVELRVREDRPAVDAAEISRVMERFGNPAVSGPVTVRFAGRSVRLDPIDFTAALSVRTAGARLHPRVDATALTALVRPGLRRAVRAPRDATVRILSGRPRVVPARVGRTYDPAALAPRFARVLSTTGSDRVLVLRPLPVAPRFGTAAARRLRITERVSHFVTRFPYAAYRNQNLGRAAALVDGSILRPGRTFSLNRTVGERTVANGFTRGYVISDGVFTEELGGGVSQVATTLYNAAFFAGLRDVEHKAHSFWISRYPAGREATVVWPDVDLRFADPTPYGVLVRASITRATPARPGTMRVSMWSTRTWVVRAQAGPRTRPTPPAIRRLRGAGCVPNAGHAGFDIVVRRLFVRPGTRTVDHQDSVRTRYAPSDTVVCSP